VGPQDVLKAIQEIEMAGVMGLGQVGADGEIGGRLERELEVFESVVRGKRKGYREKVKARESGGSNLGLSERRGSADVDEEPGEGAEREAKRARFEDEEEAAQTSQNQRHHAHHQDHASKSMPPTPTPTTNGATPHFPTNDDTRPDDDLDDEDNPDEDDNDEEDDDADTESNESEEDDDDEDEERQPEDAEDDLNGYGPDDQLRHDMNGGDEDEDEDEDGDSN
jgi:hypothetical protein